MTASSPISAWSWAWPARLRAENTIVLTGLAGLVAGACSMAMGEWLSVTSSRELYQSQIATEAEELREVPEEEKEELVLIYQAKGIDEAQARALADRLMGDKETALDTLAREELGIDPEELGGSAWQAAASSFFLFAAGAIVPLAPLPAVLRPARPGGEPGGQRPGARADRRRDQSLHRPGRRLLRAAPAGHRPCRCRRDLRRRRHRWRVPGLNPDLYQERLGALPARQRTRSKRHSHLE